LKKDGACHSLTCDNYKIQCEIYRNKSSNIMSFLINVSEKGSIRSDSVLVPYQFLL
jgi:hypothetical protein